MLTTDRSCAPISFTTLITECLLHLASTLSCCHCLCTASCAVIWCSVDPLTMVSYNAGVTKLASTSTAGSAHPYKTKMVCTVAGATALLMLSKLRCLVRHRYMECSFQFMFVLIVHCTSVCTSLTTLRSMLIEHSHRHCCCSMSHSFIHPCRRVLGRLSRPS